MARGPPRPSGGLSCAHTRTEQDGAGPTLGLELGLAHGGSVPPSPSSCLTGPKTIGFVRFVDKREVRTCLRPFSGPVTCLPSVHHGAQMLGHTVRKDGEVCAFVHVRPVCWRAASARGHGAKGAGAETLPCCGGAVRPVPH